MKLSYNETKYCIITNEEKTLLTACYILDSFFLATLQLMYFIETGTVYILSLMCLMLHF